MNLTFLSSISLTFSGEGAGAVGLCPRKFRPPHRDRGAARHLSRGRATAQKRHVPAGMGMKAAKDPATVPELTRRRPVGDR